MMELQLKKCENGWMISWWDVDRHVMVFEPDDLKEGGDVEAFQRLLYSITEFMGMSGSKHDKYRIGILTGNDDG